MAVGTAIASAIIGVIGIATSVAGSVTQAEQDRIDAQNAKDFAKRQFEQTTGDIQLDLSTLISQTQEQASFAKESQLEAYETLLGNARGSAALQQEGVTLQRDIQAQTVSQQGTQRAAATGAAQARSGAVGGSSDIIRKQQREQVGVRQDIISEQAQLSQEQIQQGLSATEATAEQRLEQSIGSIDLQMKQKLEAAEIAAAQGISAAELARDAALTGIPTTGDIAGATALDILSSSADFGSYLIDIYGD